MAKREKIFLTELGRSFKAEGSFWFKIPDSPVHAGMTTRFTVPKPFDAFVIKEGKPIAIEGKYISDYKSFGIKNMTVSQKEGLSDFQAAGGLAFVFLNIRRMADKDTNTARINRLIAFNWSDMRSMKENFSKTELLNMPYFKGAKGQFDLSKKYKQQMGNEMEVKK